VRARHQRRADRAGQHHAGAVIAHAAALERRVRAGLREHVCDAGARPEAGDVVGGLVLLRALGAVARDQSVDEPRILRRHGFCIETEPRERGGTHVRHEHVGARDQLVCERAPLGVAEVDADRALAAVVHLERRVEGQVAAEHELKQPRGVAETRRLDLHHVRAPVRENSARRGPRDPDPELDDANAFQRTHARPPVRSRLNERR
jgi:hypothetical protein